MTAALFITFAITAIMGFPIWIVLVLSCFAGIFLGGSATPMLVIAQRMFTSVDSIMAGDWRLIGRTSLIMFPIYGMGALLLPISRFIDSWLTGLPGLEDAGQDRLSRVGRSIRHGLIYMVLIFIAEYITGIWLTSIGICPWDYSLWPDNVGGVIRLKFAPLWFMTGLLFEYLTKPKGGD